MNTMVLVVAITLWHEARGEGPGGIAGVGSVIWYRTEDAYGKSKNPDKAWAKYTVSTCLAPKQFSCWNRRNLVDEVYDAQCRSGVVWEQCLTVARQIVESRFLPIVRADHYFSGKRVPRWAADMTLVETIGGHRFYWSRPA